MISVTDLRSGTIFEDRGNIFQVLSYEHIKMGRGSANIKVKVKNVRTGATTDKSFINGARVEEVHVLKKDLQFLYKDLPAGRQAFAYFMDPSTFEQVQIPLKKLFGQEYLKDGENFSISFLNDEPLSLNLPPKMDFKVLEADPGIRGNSATNIYKDAILENGLKTKVPLFVNANDTVRIDTRSGEYSEKV